jgi:hypothetical protein
LQPDAGKNLSLFAWYFVNALATMPPQSLRWHECIVEIGPGWKFPHQCNKFEHSAWRRSPMQAYPRFVDRTVTVATCSWTVMRHVEHEEGIVGVLMIKCPSTGRAISTGIEMSTMDQLPTVVAKAACPACGSVHEWTKADAWLAEGGYQYRMVLAQ